MLIIINFFLLDSFFKIILNIIDNGIKDKITIVKAILILRIAWYLKLKIYESLLLPLFLIKLSCISIQNESEAKFLLLKDLKSIISEILFKHPSRIFSSVQEWPKVILSHMQIFSTELEVFGTI